MSLKISMQTFPVYKWKLSIKITIEEDRVKSMWGKEENEVVEETEEGQSDWCWDLKVAHLK